MKEFLFFMANFLDFWFLPFIIMFIVSIIIEQVIRRQDDEKKIETAMRVRKFLWRQNILLNFSWFLCYFILMFILRGEPQQMPDLIWRG
jgi:dolichyl-phosphate-mannose--protein O-mannosyl transferase